MHYRIVPARRIKLIGMLPRALSKTTRIRIKASIKRSRCIVPNMFILQKRWDMMYNCAFDALSSEVFKEFFDEELMKN
jgi:hypothetical protein